MRYLFYYGHPAHFHLFKHTVKQLKAKGHSVIILIKKKDILEQLLKESKQEYININPEGRADNKISIAWNLLKRDFEFFKAARKFKPNLMIGTSAEISHIGTLLNIPSIVVNEDDYDVVPLFAKIAYPLATNILAPNCCKVGKWERKKISYEGYHELAYLHPKVFTPDKNLIKEIDTDQNYFILRFAKLTAHHDTGMHGIVDNIAEEICDFLINHGRVYITSERELPSKLEKYRINISPLHIHHAIYFAKLLISDSQTMSAEAGVLGTPYIRFNDFVDRISYLDELEKKYKLGFGIKPTQLKTLLPKLGELLQTSDMEKEWGRRRQKMLSDKIDVTAFMVWLFENYPQSTKITQEQPDFQDNFR